jgi:uncharacterized RDD family membrane protein YckC
VDSEAGNSEAGKSEAGRPPVARLLTAGAKGAERVAQATGVNRALDEAVEEALVRALRSPAIARAIERAIEENAATVELRSDDIAMIVRRALQSKVAEEVWIEALASEQAQRLVQRVADAPEVRAAITAQGAGLITDIGERLTRITEGLDDALERVVRPRDSDSETDEAGLATRAAAAVVDIGLLAAAYSLASGVLASVIPYTFGSQLSAAAGIVIGALAFIVGGGIFATFWALAGQTPGMRFLSIRVTHPGLNHLTLRRSIARVFAVLLSLLPLGLGYLAILRDPRRRAWADRMTGTRVIYDPVQRSAPYARAAPPAERRAPAEGKA